MSRFLEPFRSGLAPGLLFAAALILFTARLAVPQKYMFDEVYHAYTAGQYVAGNPDAYLWNTKAPREGVAYMWNHPPAGVLLIAGGILVFGDNSWGWRLASALFGAAGIVLSYFLALKLTRSNGVATLASCLLLMDGLYLAQSRIAMLDIFGVVFLMAALLAVRSYLSSPPDRVLGPLLCAGLFLGLALATKWNAAVPWALVGAVALSRALALRLPARHLVGVPIGLFALPVAVYLLAYVPFFLTGHDLAQFVELQKQILAYHVHLKATHRFQSSWWMWPLGQRPVWYFTHRAGDTVANVYAVGNAVLYAGFLPAVAWVAWKWWKARRQAELVVLLVGFLGSWLQWALVARITFLYHFLPAVPLGCITVADALAGLARAGGVRRALAFAYVGLVALFFLWLYPLEVAIPLGPRALALREWLVGLW